MKKLLAIALIAASLTACNSETKDETAAPANDSTATMAPETTTPADTAAVKPAGGDSATTSSTTPATAPALEEATKVEPAKKP